MPPTQRSSMYTFTSLSRKYAIYGPPKEDGFEYMAKFTPIGLVGRFATDSDELADKLRKHPDFGKRFMEIGIQPTSHVVEGIRSSESHPVLSDDKLIEFGRLQATLLKKDGSYRKDASDEDKQQYELLKQELGV